MAVTAETLKVLGSMRKQMTSLTNAQALALTRDWVEAWDVLQPEFNAAILELLAAAKDGRVPAGVAARNIRLRDAIQQTRATLDQLAAQTNVQVSTDVGQAILDALDQHEALIRSQLPPGNVGATVTFTRTTPEALAAMVERITQQIHKLTAPLPADIERLMKQQLIRGIAVGDNPRRTAARIIRDAEGRFNGGLTRALTIARTETMDAHRDAALQSAKANRSLVTEWMWACSFSTRTCQACLSMHGQTFPTDTPGPEGHQCCRCVRIDVTKSWADLGFDIEEPPDILPSAEDWYNNLTPESQALIMGKTRADMLTNGEISWGDLATKQDNPGWRPSYNPTPIKDLRAIGQ